jgi:hypothetical protein
MPPPGSWPGPGSEGAIVAKAALSTEPAVRAAAAAALSNVSGPQASRALTLLANDDDAGVRKLAQNSLSTRRPRPVPPPIPVKAFRRVEFKCFRDSSDPGEESRVTAAAFASGLSGSDLISITEAATAEGDMVTVWYWGTDTGMY